MKNLFQKISNYFKDSWRELKKVNWPTKAETKKRTLEVLALAFFVAILFTLVDYGLLQLMRLIIT